MIIKILPLISLITIIALFNFVLQRKHILIALLSLEASILRLALLITLSYASSAFSELFICLVILTLGACEARVALALLVLISRSFGSDMIKSISINKC